MRPVDFANSPDRRSAYNSTNSLDGRSANARWGSPSLPDGMSANARWGGNLVGDDRLDALKLSVNLSSGGIDWIGKHDVSVRDILPAPPWLGVIGRGLESEPQENRIVAVVDPRSKIE